MVVFLFGLALCLEFRSFGFTSCAFCVVEVCKHVAEIAGSQVFGSYAPAFSAAAVIISVALICHLSYNFTLSPLLSGGSCVSLGWFHLSGLKDGNGFENV